MGNPVTWFEINGASPADASQFYADLFGWQTQTLPGDYIMVDTGAGRGMNGGFGTTAPGPAGAVFYAQGPDLQALLDRATQLGGVMVMPVTEIPDMVTYAHFRDPWDNTIGLVKGDIDQVPAITGGDNPPMDWFEIACTEPEKAIDFYRELFGWQIAAAPAEGFVHASVDTGAGGGARGGIGSSPDERSHVVLYAAVDDLSAYVGRANSLGATTVIPPTQVDPNTTIALLADPQEVAFGMYHWEG